MAHKDLENAHKRRVDELKSGMQAEKCKATFACGGSLTLSPENNDNVTVRFGPDGKGSKLSLPCKGDDPAFQKLIAACDPASFGKGGQDVFDETYRKATKLNQDDFCTDFCPYTLGMVDIINQLLVPSIDKKRSVRAELYKLNVYSGPSGKFKAHVDTPRSEMQVGSLVVCLPSPFTGKLKTLHNIYTWKLALILDQVATSPSATEARPSTSTGRVTQQLQSSGQPSTAIASTRSIKSRTVTASP